MSGFQRAQKEQSKLRLALLGPAGAGKTYTGLTLAKHLGGKVAVIDSEHGSASKYADLFEFDTDSTFPDHSPETYIGKLREAEKAGYDVVLIDSLSHEWKWCLDEVDNVIARTNNRNSYAAWREITPRHNALTEAILASGCHVIGTMRTKMDYVLEEDEKGKKAPRKVGMAPVQRDGIEYEFDLIGDLDIDNKMVVSKTRCPALAGAVIRKPGVELAETLKGWLGTGTEPAPPAPVPAAAEETREAGGGGDKPVAEPTEEWKTATKGMWATISELVDAGRNADDIKTELYAFYGVTSTKQLTLGEVKQATSTLKKHLAELKAQAA